MTETRLADFDAAARSKYTNIERLEHGITTSGFDAVIAMSPENVPYVSGFYNFDLRVIPERAVGRQRV